MFYSENRKAMKNKTEKCDCCGKFINLITAEFIFTPDSAYTVEKCAWRCEKCFNKYKYK